MSQDIVLCEQCDAVHRWRPLAPSEVARCRRCGAVIARGPRLTVTGLLALTVTAAVALLVAVFTPMMTLQLRGDASAASMLDAIVAPAVLVGLRLLVLWPMAHGRCPDHLAWCMRALHEASRWSMVEVLLVGAVVSVVRIASMAPSMPGPGMFAFAALTLLLAALESAGMRHLWQELS